VEQNRKRRWRNHSRINRKINPCFEDQPRCSNSASGYIVKRDDTGGNSGNAAGLDNPDYADTTG
jgi:hypothetical protein